MPPELKRLVSFHSVFRDAQAGLHSQHGPVGAQDETPCASQLLQRAYELSYGVTTARASPIRGRFENAVRLIARDAKKLADNRNNPEVAAEEEDNDETCPDADAAAQQFEALSSGDGGEGGGGMMGSMMSLHKESKTVDCQQQQQDGSGEGPPADGVPDELREALKGAVDGAKDKMKDMLSEAWGDFMSDNPLMDMIGGMKEGLEEKLQAFKEGLGIEAEGDAAGGDAGGDSASGPGKQKPGAAKAKVDPTAKVAKPRPQVYGPTPWLSHGLSEKESQLQRRAAEFACEHILPHASQWEARAHLPRDMFRQAGKEGFCNMVCGKIAGGEGLTHSESAAVFEALGAADLATTAVLAQQNAVAWVMDKYASVLLRQTFVRALGSGLVLGTYALSEPLAGADPRGTLSFAVPYKDQTGDYWIINGLKNWVMLGGSADMYLVAARTSPDINGGLSLFLIPKIYPGMFWLGKENMIGGRAVPVRKLVFAVCIVRDEFMVGGQGKATDMLERAMDGFRVNLAAACVGAAHLAVNYATEFARHRRTAKQGVLDWQSVQHRLADMLSAVAAARLMVQDAAHSLDVKARSGACDAALAKRYAWGVASSVVRQALNLLGGAGMSEEHALAKVARDLTLYAVLGGPNDVCVAPAWKQLQVRSKRARQTGAARTSRHQQQGQHGGEGGEEEEEEEDAEQEGDAGLDE